VLANQVLHHVHLLEGHRHGGVRLDEVRRHVDRPALGAHPARLETGEIGVQGRDPGRDVGGLAPLAGPPQLPGEVVVGVEERRRAQQLDEVPVGQPRRLGFSV
jgi:hypothetical protein